MIFREAHPIEFSVSILWEKVTARTARSCWHRYNRAFFVWEWEHITVCPYNTTNWGQLGVAHFCLLVGVPFFAVMCCHDLNAVGKMTITHCCGGGLFISHFLSCYISFLFSSRSSALLEQSTSAYNIQFITTLASATPVSLSISSTIPDLTI
jgi:hypothetical protein